MNTSSENIERRPQGMAESVRQESRKIAGAVSDGMRAGRQGVEPRTTGEGMLTKQIESVTSKIPSATFLSAAVGAIGVSLLLQISGRKKNANFVGQWVPTILLLGLYNKIVKLEGSE